MKGEAMGAKFKAVLTAILAAMLLAACATTPEEEQPPVGVEARKPGVGVGPEATPAPVDRQPIARVEVTGKPPGTPFDALKDPGSILSKRSIYYDYDKFDIKDEYRSLIEAHAKFLRENPSARMLIQGNTDERGSREYNVGLGQRRSDGVKSMLQLLGARENQIESVSLGEEKPVAEGSNEQAWAKNRRSDMLYTGEY
jgi:peptidoglycan-associated lipoprotein